MRRANCVLWFKVMVQTCVTSHAISTLELWGGRQSMESAAAPSLFLAFAFL